MIAAPIITWLLALPLWLDGYTHGAPIARHERNVFAIANAAIETERPKFWAALLDVWGAYESGNADANVGGGCPGVHVGTPCRRDQGARYCGPWMVTCSRVPAGSTLLDEARIAIRMFRESALACPSFPFGQYAGVGCRQWDVVDLRLALVRRAHSIPLPPEDP
jgi:hypothetical protein